MVKMHIMAQGHLVKNLSLSTLPLHSLNLKTQFPKDYQQYRNCTHCPLQAW